jgi:hypothetical protein
MPEHVPMPIPKDSKMNPIYNLTTAVSHSMNISFEYLIA